MNLTDTRNKAELSGPGKTPITFDFNPATITISHSVTTHSNAGKGKPSGGKEKPGGNGNPPGGNGNPPGGAGGTPAVSYGDFNAMVAASGVTTIAVRQVTFIGKKVQETCEQLHGWTVLDGDKNNGTSGSNESTQQQDLPTLTFRWGNQTYLVTLNQLTINYTRFTPKGDPVRAVVDMTFNLAGTSGGLTKTNPTSGGLPGRRSHVLTGAETLAGLSTKTYGSPGGWRQIAAANGIQDPLRVAPGTRLYLPSPEEIGR